MGSSDDETLVVVVPAGLDVEPTAASRSRGRPRSRKSDGDIIAAAAELLASGGYSGVTFEKVAARAGVTRPTIYRRWPTKAILICAVLGANLPAVPQLGGKSFVGDLREIQTHYAAIIESKAWRELVPGLLSDLLVDPDAEVLFREYWRGAYDAAIVDAVSGALKRGDLAAAPDVSLVGDLLIGPLFFRALMSPDPLSADYVDAVFDHVIAGLLD